MVTLQGKGLSGTFESTTNKITMFAPVNAAFSQEVFSVSSTANAVLMQCCKVLLSQCLALSANADARTKIVQQVEPESQ